ncbi:MAG: phosphoribosyl-ATP diphosphatase [Gammaproteobacteria bacterium]|jgi:phosphoribosyl-ATP pyrophosphohydrolase|nr:phosphoribosyl-ATP diphosphatase [Gammaproteobacteria bacterium]
MEVDVLHQLAAILEQRKSADPGSSYVAKLYAGGMDLIRKKIGEEATEVVIAAGNEDDAALIHEVADLWFHSLVALSARNLGHEAVLAELGRRFGVSGIEEKASRRGQ